MEPDTYALSVSRLAGTGAVMLAAAYSICWAGLFVSFGSVDHDFIAVSMSAGMSGADFIWGLVWSAVVGFIAGGTGAFVYNLLGGSRGA